MCLKLRYFNLDKYFVCFILCFSHFGCSVFGVPRGILKIIYYWYLTIQYIYESVKYLPTNQPTTPLPSLINL